MELSTIVFDLGGTLIEYAGTFSTWPELETPGFMAAYNYLRQQDVALPNFMEIRDTGFKLLPERWQQATAGKQNLRLREFLGDVLQICGVSGMSAAKLTTAAELYESALTAQASVMPAAKETLAQVRAQGYRIGLVSNTMFTGKAHQADLARFGLIDYFDTMLFSADVNKWKPTAAPFLQVLADLNVPPERAVYVGDDPASDVVGGRRAGMYTIHFKSSQRFTKSIETRPHAQIHGLHELLPLVNSWANGGWTS